MLNFADSLAQLICTHYSSLLGQPDIFLGSGTLKNQVQNMDMKKAGSKKQGHCYSKREEAPDFFQGHKTTQVFKTRIVGADWLGNCVLKQNIWNASYKTLYEALND